jgi:hypothetical protein
MVGMGCGVGLYAVCCYAWHGGGVMLSNMLRVGWAMWYGHAIDWWMAGHGCNVLGVLLMELVLLKDLVASISYA